MLRFVTLILLILLIALEVKLWAGQGGMAEVWGCRRQSPNKNWKTRS